MMSPDLRGRENVRIGVSAHAAGIRALISVEDPLVVLAGASGQRLSPSLRPMKLTSSPSRNSSMTRFGPSFAIAAFGFGPIPGDHYTFTGGEAIGLNYNRKAKLYIGKALRAVGMPARSEQLLGEDFEALMPSSCRCRWADNLEAAPPEYVDDACDQRRFGTDYCQIDAMCFGEFGIGFQPWRGPRRMLPSLSDAGIARATLECS